MNSQTYLLSELSASSRDETGHWFEDQYDALHREISVEQEQWAEEFGRATRRS